MSDEDEKRVSKRPTGRRTGDSGTRDAILDSARDLFSQMGYDATSIRTIATSAGVDPALIRHFFGDKATLFAASLAEYMTVPERMWNAFKGDPAHIGSRIVDTYLRLWEDDETRHIMMALVRSASTSDNAAEMLKMVLGSRVRGAPQLAEADPDQSKRVAIVASHMLGIGFTRYVLKLPDVASRSHEDLVAEIGPTIQRYLTATHL